MQRLYTDTIPPSDNELFREFDKLIPAAVWIMHGSIRLAQQGFEQLCRQLSARLAGVGLTPATLSLRSLKLAIACTRGFMKRGLHVELPDAVPEALGGVTGQAQNPPLS